jgi:hypothetical protein
MFRNDRNVAIVGTAKSGDVSKVKSEAVVASKEHSRTGTKGVSRRAVLKNAALGVGAAATVASAGSALARTADVIMDSAGRVIIDGAPVPPDGSFQEARGGGGGGSTGSKASGVSGTRKADNFGCTNAGGCARPAAVQKAVTPKKGNNYGCTNTAGCGSKSLRRH